MQTRVRQASGGWMIDRKVWGLFWLPLGRWIHQDWWAPYQFDTAQEALHFANVARAKRRASLSTRNGGGE